MIHCPKTLRAVSRDLRTYAKKRFKWNGRSDPEGQTVDMYAAKYIKQAQAIEKKAKAR